MPAQTVIQLRRDTSANWESADPILASGEAGFDTTENKIKIGDGTSSWTELDYASGGSGSITVSETAPADPAEGDLWFNSTNALTYIYYDSFWVDLAPAIAGPAGLIGEPGIVVQDEEPTNTDVLWLDSDDPADAVAVPAGGETGQVLAKATGDDYDTEWTTLPEAPTPVSSGNAIINGAFEINQRNFTSSTVFAYGYDRWGLNFSGGTGTFSAQTFTLGTEPQEGFDGANFLRASLTTGNDFAGPFTRIEDARTFAGQTATLSFYAKGTNPTTAGNLKVRLLRNYGSGGSAAELLSQQTFVLTADWTRYSFTVSIPSLSGKTVGAGSHLDLLLGQGDNTSTDAWTLDLWGVQLEAGSVATPFKRNANTLQGELAACQRYYFRVQPPTVSKAVAEYGSAGSSTVVRTVIRPPVPMRAEYTSIDFNALSVYDAAFTNFPVTSVGNGGSSSKDLLHVVFNVSSGGLTTHRPYKVFNNVGGFLGFSAEL